jgi:fucose permease
MNAISRKHIFLITAFVYMSLFGLGLIDNLRGALLPEILKTYALNNSQGAWFFIFTSGFSILGSVAAPILNDVLSPIATWRLGVIFMGLGGIALYGAGQTVTLFTGCAVLGTGFGLLAVMQNVLITRITPASYTNKILAGLHSMYGFASFLSPMMVTVATINNFGWHYLFLGVGLITLGLFAGSFLIPNLTQFQAIQEERPAQSWRSSLSTAHVHYALIISTYVAMELLISTRLTTYLVDHLHWSLAVASRYLTYFFISLLFGRVLFSFFHPPMSLRKTLLLCLLTSMLFLLLGLHIDPIYLCLSGFFMAPFYPLAMALLAELYPTEVARMISLSISSQSVLVILMNIIVGDVSDRYGISLAMNTAFGFGGLSWLLLMNLKTKPMAHSAN